jgi:hypothetical protein
MGLGSIFKRVVGLLEHWGTSPEFLGEVKERLARPIPGEEYVHAKTGNRYTVLAVGIYCGKWAAPDNDDYRAEHAPEPMRGFPERTELVVYVGHYDNKREGGNRIYIRPLDEWREVVHLQVACRDCEREKTDGDRREYYECPVHGGENGRTREYVRVPRFELA